MQEHHESAVKNMAVFGAFSAVVLAIIGDCVYLYFGNGLLQLEL